MTDTQTKESSSKLFYTIIGKPTKSKKVKNQLSIQESKRKIRESKSQPYFGGRTKIKMTDEVKGYIIEIA